MNDSQFFLHALSEAHISKFLDLQCYKIYNTIKANKSTLYQIRLISKFFLLRNNIRQFHALVLMELTFQSCNGETKINEIQTNHQM